MVNIPDTYYGKPVDTQDGLFHCDPDGQLFRFIDHACGTWFYGHDERGGQIIPWMRLRETVDRSHNDVHQMETIDGIWRTKK